VAGGRLGVFLQYSGDILKRGTYSGSVYQPEFSNLYADIDLSEKYDNFVLRALYAKALTNKFKLGGEVSLSHVKEMNELARVSYYSDMSVSNETVNQPAGANFSYLYAYMLPRDSRYWETNLKASLETNLDPVKLDFSVFGGFIFDGDDKYDWRNGGNYLNQDGNIKGSKFGGELWLRLPVDDTLSIPLLLKAVYSKKTHRGDGFGNQGFTGSYDGSDRSKYFEFGAGLDKKFGKGGFATGLYYSFLDTQATLDYATSDGGHYYYAPYPNLTEKRLTLKFAGEADVSSKFSLNGGLAFYYGWIDQQFTRDSSSYGLEDISNNGDIWGIGASLGATVKLNGFTIEPYAKAGYSKLRLTGDGVTFYPLSSSDYKKNQWNVGGGFALRF
ncbi:MAG TPA: autotransporter outer membrane beta-barrel domain-containing protein, partial [Syntrophorhabdaceae bacterium]|nr:autotransporter outer membrane beta-barrel domain-containing protein [Syntrophorhabdaceae bacterium]